MSVTIVYRQVKPEKYKSFSNGTSSDLRVLEEEFGGTIEESDVRSLRAMERATRNCFYGEVADAVEKYGKIKVWGEY